MVGPFLYPLACEYKMYVGIIFEQQKECWDKPLGDALAPPNQSRSEHVQTHGSVDERHVSGDYGHLCPPLQQLKYPSCSVNNPWLTLKLPPTRLIYCRPHNNMVMHTYKVIEHIKSIHEYSGICNHNDNKTSMITIYILS